MALTRSSRFPWAKATGWEGFGVQGSRFRVEGLGFRVEGFGYPDRWEDIEVETLRRYSVLLLGNFLEPLRGIFSLDPRKIQSKGLGHPGANPKGNTL